MKKLYCKTECKRDGKKNSQTCCNSFDVAIANRLGIRWAFLGLVLLLGTSYILLAIVHQLWGIIFIATIYVVCGLQTPLLLNCLNYEVASKIRATVLSVNSFVFRLGFVMVGPWAGWLADAYSLDLAFVIFGIIFLIAGMACWQRLKALQVI